MFDFEPGRPIVEEVRSGDQQWKLVSAVSSLRGTVGKSGFELSYRRPLYVESAHGDRTLEIVDYTMMARMTAIVVALFMTVRSIIK